MPSHSPRQVRHTAEEIDQMIATGRDRTEWSRLDQLSEAELEEAIALDEGQPDWLHATTELPEAKQPVSIRLDIDVLQWFKNQGSGYQTRMNQVLRRYVEAQRRKA